MSATKPLASGSAKASRPVLFAILPESPTRKAINSLARRIEEIQRHRTLTDVSVGLFGIPSRWT